MNNLVKSVATVVNGNESCNCGRGQIVCLSAFALQKTHSDKSKKTYVYVLEVRRSDSTEYKIHRSHSDLVCLANSLPRLKELVLQKKLKKTDVPKIPDRVERTKDLSKITKYFASLLPLQEENNVVCKALSKFCQQDPSCDTCSKENAVGIVTPDKKSNLMETGSSRSILNISPPMALPSCRVTLSYKPEDKRQMSIQENTIVQIYKKCPTGWWYVIHGEKSGWFPASYLQMIDRADDDDDTTPLEKPERYKTTCDYVAQNDDELSFTTNTIVNVMLKKMDGWWLAECLGQEGYVPATYLRPCDVRATDCNDMCWVTMNMKLKTNRCSEDAYPKKAEEESRKEVNGGIDLMPEDEIIREEDHMSNSSVERIESSNATSDRSSFCSSSNNSSTIIIINRCEEEMEGKNEDASRTQL